MNPIVIVYGNDAARCRPLIRSLDKWGWLYLLIGYQGFWKGFGHKLKSVVEAMRDPRWPREGFTHALSVDGYDTLAVGPPSELEAAFAAYGDPGLLYAAEAACWPTNIDHTLYPDNGLGRWRFPHSPFAVDLSRLDLLDVSGVADNDDDQAFAHWNYGLGTKPGVKLDTGCRWMQSVAHANPWSQTFAVESDRVRNLVNGSLACFLHGNGQTDISWVPGGK